MPALLRSRTSSLDIWLRQKKTSEPIIVTHHGKPYALIQSITEKDLEELGWKTLAQTRLEEAWVGEDDALYESALCAALKL